MTVAVVTGAASGMGPACIEAIRDQTDTIIAVDLVAPEVDGPIGVACDVTDPVAIKELVALVGDTGEFRTLVHAAGISPTMAGSRRVFDVDLLGTERLLDAFESLVTQGSVAVCFASSAAHQIAAFVDDDARALLRDPFAIDFLDRAAALYPDSGFAYAMAKHGVLLAVERAAIRWGALGGRVVSVSPGLIDTPMGQAEMAAQPIMQEMLAKAPLSRLGRADEVARVAAFLASDAASYVSGIDVLVDGAMVAGFSAP